MIQISSVSVQNNQSVPERSMPSSIIAQPVLQLPSGQTIPFELLLQFVYQQLIEDSQKDVVRAQHHLQLEQQYRNIKENEYATRINDLSNQTERSQSLHKANAYASLVASGTAAVSALFTANYIVGAAGLLHTGLLALDRYCDEALSKNAASWIAHVSGTDEKAWRDGIYLGSSILAIALSVGAAPTRAFNIIEGCGKLTLSALSGQAKMKEQEYKKEFETLETQLKLSDEHTEKCLEQVRHLSNQFFQHLEAKFGNVLDYHNLVTQVARGIQA